MTTVQDEHISTKQLRQLVPISQVVFRALMEEEYARAYAAHAVEFLLEAQDVWKNKHSGRGYKHPGAYYLGRTYQILEEQNIISVSGRILNPQSLAAPNGIDGRLCHPRGFAATRYFQTEEFKKLATSRSARARKGRSK